VQPHNPFSWSHVPCPEQERIVVGVTGSRITPLHIMLQFRPAQPLWHEHAPVPSRPASHDPCTHAQRNSHDWPYAWGSVQGKHGKSCSHFVPHPRTKPSGGATKHVQMPLLQLPRLSQTLPLLMGQGTVQPSEREFHAGSHCVQSPRPSVRQCPCVEFAKQMQAPRLLHEPCPLHSLLVCVFTGHRTSHAGPR